MESKKDGPEDIAAQLLRQDSISAKDVEQLLDRVHFRPNVSRKNVTPDGSNFVYSETVGIIRTRTQISMISVWTHRYPTVVQVINKWVKQQGWIEDNFCFSSLTINKKIYLNYTEMGITTDYP